MEEKWKNLIVTFVKEYYSIYDSDSRRNLMAAYAENVSRFGFCVCVRGKSYSCFYFFFPVCGGSGFLYWPKGHIFQFHPCKDNMMKRIQSLENMGMCIISKYLQTYRLPSFVWDHPGFLLSFHQIPVSRFHWLFTGCAQYYTFCFLNQFNHDWQLNIKRFAQSDCKVYSSGHPGSLDLMFMYQAIVKLTYDKGCWESQLDLLVRKQHALTC